MFLLLALFACKAAESDSDTDVVDTEPVVPPIVLIGATVVPGPWDTWFSAHGEVVRYAYDDTSAPVIAAESLVVFLPELPASAKDSAAAWMAHGGYTLGMGVGGARAYEGVDLGLGINDGGQGAVDGLLVEDETHPVFADLQLADDGIVTVTTSAVTDVGIRPSNGVTVLGWDRRYEGSFADLCYNDKAWFWGWGSATDGLPEDLTDDGQVLFGATVDFLITP